MGAEEKKTIYDLGEDKEALQLLGKATLIHTRKALCGVLYQVASLAGKEREFDQIVNYNCIKTLVPLGFSPDGIVFTLTNMGRIYWRIASMESSEWESGIEDLRKHIQLLADNGIDSKIAGEVIKFIEDSRNAIQEKYRMFKRQRGLFGYLFRLYRALRQYI